MLELDIWMAASNARARRRRRLARWMVGGVALILFLAGFLYVAALDGPSAMVMDPGLTTPPALALGLIGLLVGLAWMIRILRAKPEPDTKAWRYRRKP